MRDEAYGADGTDEIFLTLHSGLRIDARRIMPDEIRIDDIAHALSHLCRFAGHVPTFYSVAQHSLIVCELLPKEPLLQLQGLLHDATEAYLVDVPHYVKHSPELEGYRRLEADLETKILNRFGLPSTLDPRVKMADRSATEIEWRQMMRRETVPGVYPILPWASSMARMTFLAEYRKISLALGRSAITVA
jgi:hypothetical protein